MSRPMILSILVSLLVSQASHAGLAALFTYFPYILQDSAEMQEAGFVDCIRDRSLPTPQLLPAEYFNKYQKRANRGEITSISADIHEMNEQTTRYVWFVSGPKYSVQYQPESMIPYVGKEFYFKPDTFGIHRLVLITQDASGSCTGVEQSLFVSVNDPPESSGLPVDVNLEKMQWRQKIQLEQAQQYSKGAGITVAIIGTGIDYHHPELIDSLWSKECKTTTQQNCEIAANGIDDDQNGYIDDINGWDFRENDPFGFDDVFHETGVAGFVAAKSFGVAPEAKIMNLKVFDSTSHRLDKIAPAIEYAAREGANVINISSGFFPRYTTEATPQMISQLQRAFDFAEQNGVLIVVSAGNGYMLGPRNIDEEPFLPSSFENGNILSVAALTSQNGLANYSNYGEKAVDVAAPGGELPRNPIQMLLPQVPHGDAFSGTQGTSFAAPIVSGIVALTLSAHPDRYIDGSGKIRFSLLREQLLKSGELLTDLTGKVGSKRAIDALQLVK